MANKQSSSDIMWEFLAPDEKQFGNRRTAFTQLWNELSKPQQRRIYATLFWQREQKVAINENPYFAVKNCEPHPFNYNGQDVPLPTDRRLYIAFYKGGYGIYSKLDTEAFEMTDKREFKV
ncbi:MAG: hypothetical protein IK073_00780 [Paludibacteraceae bacterium]|nr:hypothetical protein [Paludibacteraceae bacterium]